MNSHRLAQTASHCIVRCLLLLLLAGAVASCHKGASVKSHRDYHRETRDGSGRTDGRTHTDGDWATLDIALTRDDNAALYRELRAWLGTPYQYAASTRGVGTDCSGMVMEVYRTVYGKVLERNSARMYEKNCTPVQREKLREGDLVFFNGKQPGRITHVGIYLKDGHFAHTSSSRGVMVSHLDDRYWREHYQCAGRVK
ncbi:MAG: C40 family peptidase [Muribaculaceae bacterium]|nr:C40 family peptidase [Muribaculaceae bacterium]